MLGKLLNSGLVCYEAFSWQQWLIQMHSGIIWGHLKKQMPGSYSQRLCIGLSIRILKNSSGNPIVQARCKKLPLYPYRTCTVLILWCFILTHCSTLIWLNLPYLTYFPTAQILWCFKPQENHAENSNNLASEVQPMI